MIKEVFDFFREQGDTRAAYRLGKDELATLEQILYVERGLHLFDIADEAERNKAVDAWTREKFEETMKIRKKPKPTEYQLKHEEFKKNNPYYAKAVEMLGGNVPFSLADNIFAPTV